MDLQVFMMELLLFPHSVPRVLGVEPEMKGLRMMKGDRGFFAEEAETASNRFRHCFVIGVGVTLEHPSNKSSVFPVLVGAVKVGVGVDDTIFFVWSSVGSS